MLSVSLGGLLFSARIDTIPIRSPNGKFRHQAMMIEKADFSKLTVLLVDDNQFIRKLLVDILRSFRVDKVVEAAGVEAALFHLGSMQPAVIFFDLLMGPVDGLSLLRAVRQGRTPIDPKTPIIMLTAGIRVDHVAVDTGAGD